ncbi:hypothetical protein J1N35_025900 [Gossypium stocksii]|uniref:RNase H type-1 domain-containing protein n=1 Tax=Gossypium stocksii TaxID=47602 RepID=A0A9D3V747_9ROSI|nr:hypothetical protein J1N35_025900 [Gossypium stocksii]
MNSICNREYTKGFWQPPPTGWMKINTNGSFTAQSSSVAVGGVFRDHEGEWLLKFDMNICRSSVYQTEARAFCEGMIMSWNEVLLKGRVVDECHITSDEREEDIGRGAVSTDKGMGYKRSLVAKHHNGLGELQFAEDVTTGSRSGHRLDAIVLKNDGRLGVNRWMLVSEGDPSFSSCRRRTIKSFHGGDVVDGSDLRAIVAGDGRLEWISTGKVLTIGLFTVECFCQRLQLATDVDRGEFGSFLFLEILVFRRRKLKCI